MNQLSAVAVAIDQAMNLRLPARRADRPWCEVLSITLARLCEPNICLGNESRGECAP